MAAQPTMNQPPQMAGVQASPQGQFPQGGMNPAPMETQSFPMPNMGMQPQGVPQVQAPQQIGGFQFQQPQQLGVTTLDNMPGVTPMQVQPQPGQPGMVPQQSYNPYQQQPAQVQQPQYGQPVMQPMDFLSPQKTPEQMFLDALQSQDKSWESRIEKLVSGLKPAVASGPDYFSMSPEQLVEEFEKNGTQVLRTVMERAKQEAVETLQNTYETKLSQQEGMINAIMKQHLETNAAFQIQRLKQSYGTDPQFEQHMRSAAQFLATPAGVQLQTQMPDQAVEYAYRLQLVDRVFDPNYRAQIGQQFAQMQNQYDTTRMQQVGPMPSVQQNFQPMQQFGPMQTQQQGPTDTDVLRSILSNGPNAVSAIPNVRFVPQETPMVTF